MKAILTRGKRVLLDRETRELARHAPMALIVRGGGGLAQILLNILLARYLGAAGLGIYVIAFTVATIASTIGRLGLETAAIRFSAEESVRDNGAALKPLYWAAWRITFGVSAATSLFLLFLAPWLSSLLADGDGLTVPLRVMALGVTPMSVSLLQVGFLRGIKRVSTAAAAETLGIPLIISCCLLVMGPAVGIVQATVLTDLAIVAVYVCSSFAWHRAAPGLPRSRSANSKHLFRVGLSIFWTSAMNYVMQFAPTVLVASFAGPSAAGVYALAMRLSMVSNVIGSAVSSVVAPQFAIQMATGDMNGLGRLGRRSTAAMTALSLPLLLPLVLAPKWIMGAFGTSFRHGAGTLALLAVGQVIQTVTGAVGYLLVMTGHEREMRTITIVSTVIFLGLNLVLIPALGIMGAATAYALGMLIVNVWKTTVVHKRLGVIVIPGLRRGGATCVANA